MIQTNRSQIRPNNGIELEKAYSSKAGWYDLSYPGTWRLNEDEECITFYEPLNDIGVLQMSAYLAPSPQSPHDLLVEHFIDRGMTVNHANLQYREDDYKETASYDYIDNKRYYRTWIVTSGNYVMLITYICDESKKDMEISIAEAIVASIRFRESESG